MKRFAYILRLANQDGKIPVNDSLLSGTVPGAVDAWYILLSRWGTRTFGELLAPAIEIAEHGAPIGRSLNSAALMKYPTSAKVYAPPDGKRRLRHVRKACSMARVTAAP